MRLYTVGLVLATVLIVECSHTFMGTSVMRQLIFHKAAKYNANAFTKRIEFVNFSMYAGQTIQGILAYDLSNSGSSANVTSGGLGYGHVTLRLKSDRAKPLHYDIYVYA